MNADVLIVGGGITGLNVARCLKVEACLFEKETTLGGCLRSDQRRGYTVDRTGHLLHFQDPYVRRVMFEELSIDWLHFKRQAEIQVLGERVPYPIQYHLHALPSEERVQCFTGYLDAMNNRPDYQDSFNSWSRASYGRGLHDLFFEPYNRKLWQVDLDSISAEWAERFVPLPDRELIIRGALNCHRDHQFGYNATFSYPRQGGSQAIVDALAADTPVPIHTGTSLVSVDPIARVCEFSNGERVHYRALVSTLPLPSLVRCLDPVDPDIREMAGQLRHNSVFYFAFGYKTGGAAPAPHWVYIPEARYSMYRVGVLSNYSPTIAPPGSVLLCAEIAFPGDRATLVDSAALRDRVLADLEAVGLVQPGWSLEFEHRGSIGCAYVIYDDARRNVLPSILGYLERHGIHSIGRYGAWGYGSIGDALIEGRDCAETLNGLFRAAGRTT